MVVGRGTELAMRKYNDKWEGTKKGEYVGIFDRNVNNKT